MTVPEYYEPDLLSFFDGHPLELSLYQALFSRLDRLCPDASVKVQKSQISFYCPRLFATAPCPPAGGRNGLSAAWLSPLAWSTNWNPPGWLWRWNPIPTGGPIMFWLPGKGRLTMSCWAGWRRPTALPGRNGPAGGRHDGKGLETAQRFPGPGQCDSRSRKQSGSWAQITPTACR